MSSAAVVQSPSSLSIADKLPIVFSRVGTYAGPDVGQALSQFITKRNLEIMAITLGVWAVAQAFAVGEIVDIVLLAGGIYALGANAVTIAEDLFQAGSKTIDAQTDDDLSLAAQFLARAIVEGGVEVVLALLMRKDLGEIKIKIARLKTIKPGLIHVPPPPKSTPQLKIEFQTTLGTGTQTGWVYGETDVYGQITIARQGLKKVTQPNGSVAAQWVKFTAQEKTQTILHEIVHRALTPKMGPLLEFRLSLGISGYTRVAFLKYLEEALAQSYALAKTEGLSGVWTGIKFPVKNGYVKLWQAASPVSYGGAIMIGEFFCFGHKYRVGYYPGHSDPQAAPTYEWQLN